MLNQFAFANGFAAVGGLFYILLYFLKMISPPFFQLLINSQFFGADIASQIPKTNIANFLGLLIVISAFGWFFGYLVAAIYNLQLKSKPS